MSKTNFVQLFKSLSLLLPFIFFVSGCGSKKAVIDRNFSLPEKTDNGYIYGKLEHNHKFGTKFKITFKNRSTNSLGELNMELYSSDAGSKNFFIELEPGEYLLAQIVPEVGVPTDIPTLEKDEHREFIVEAGKITYVGSWIFSEGKIEVVNEKETQDDYMHTNFKYISTSIAHSSLP